MTQPTDDDLSKAAAIWQELLTMPADSGSENEHCEAIIARALADAREPLQNMVDVHAQALGKARDRIADLERRIEGQIAENGRLQDVALERQERITELELERDCAEGALANMTRERDRLRKRVALLKSERDEAYEELSPIDETDVVPTL